MSEVSVMKLLLALITAVSASNAFACQEEAQFIGKVKNQHLIGFTEGQHVCAYQIEFSRFNPNMTCELSDSDASTTKFIDIGCKKRNGSDASGYLVRKDGVIVWERN